MDYQRTLSAEDDVKAARARLLHFSLGHSLDELLEETLNEAEKLTGSLIGFYHFVDDAQASLTLQNWSARTKAEFCKAEGKGLHYPIARAGVWVDCVYQRKPVIHNDYASLPHRKGMPEGHAAVVRELVVPVMRGGRITAVLGVGNKPADYTQSDVEAVSLLADLAWDIAARKRAEEALGESEAMHRDLVAKLPAGVIVIDPLTREIESVNARAAAMFGAAAERIIGQRCHSFLCPAQEKECPVLDLGQNVDDSERVMVHADGSRHPVLKSVARIQVHGKDKLLECFVDIEERKKAEAALRESEERFRALVETSSDWIWELDADGVFTYSSPKCLAITGYSPQEIVGRTPFSFMAPEEAARVSGFFRDTSASSREFSGFENTTLHKSGKEVVAETSGVAVTGPAGELLGWRGINRDITERKLMEDQLRQAQKLEALGRLAGGVAHDFNNILTAIAGYSGFLLRALPPGGEQACDAAEIKTAVERASALTRQLLAFGRRQVLQPKVLDLNAVISGIKPMLARLIGENIELAVDLAGDLRSVKADRGQLEQVIINLAINARDAMPKGGKLVISTANAELEKESAGMRLGAPPGRYAALAVSDTGPGMDRDTLSRLFEPFFTTKEKGRGTGLGLATVYGIIKQSGGDIHVYSEPGRGSVFKVCLPEAEGSVAEEAAAVPCRMPRGEGAVLIVEDEEQVRKVAGRILAGHGYRVVEADSPQEAIGLCKRGGRFDLLLTDIVLPEMGGRELFGRVSKLHPGIRAVFMSGYAGEALTETDLISGEAPFVQKPFSAEALLLVVGKALAGRAPAA